MKIHIKGWIFLFYSRIDKELVVSGAGMSPGVYKSKREVEKARKNHPYPTMPPIKIDYTFEDGK